jgi:hypothetical protein
MKTFVLLFCLVLFFPVVYAQKTPVKTDHQVSKDFISGKRWKIKSILVSEKEKAVAAFDCFWFRPGGVFEMVRENRWYSGTWTYNKVSKEVTVTPKDEAAQKWQVLESSASVLKLKSAEAEVHFVPDVEVRTDIKLSGKKKDISRAWKITEHKKGQLKIVSRWYDFLRLHPDGNMEFYESMIYQLGTWSYDADNHLLNLVFQGVASKWKINTLAADQMVIEKQGGAFESFSLTAL